MNAPEYQEVPAFRGRLDSLAILYRLMRDEYRLTEAKESATARDFLEEVVRRHEAGEDSGTAAYDAILSVSGNPPPPWGGVGGLSGPMLASVFRRARGVVAGGLQIGSTVEAPGRPKRWYIVEASR